MNVESASSSESLADHVNDRTYWRQQLLAISKRLMAVTHHSPTDLTWTTATGQVSCCRAFLYQSDTTLKSWLINSPDTFICVSNTTFPNRPRGRTNERPNGRSPIGMRKRRPLCNGGFSSRNRSQQKRRAQCTIQSEKCLYLREGNGLRSGSQPRPPIEDHNGLAGQYQKLEVEAPGMAISPVARNISERDVTLGGRLNVSEPAAATILPPDEKMRSNWILTRPTEFNCSQKKNYKVLVRAGIKSSILRSTVRVFHTRPEPNLVCRPSFQ